MDCDHGFHCGLCGGAAQAFTDYREAVLHIRVDFTARQPLPVYPRHRTVSGPVGISQRVDGDWVRHRRSGHRVRADAAAVSARPQNVADDHPQRAPHVICCACRPDRFDNRLQRQQEFARVI